MTLRENYKIENDGIWAGRKELEAWRDHYWAVADGRGDMPDKLYHLGKAYLLMDMLKMFEPLEP